MLSIEYMLTSRLASCCPQIGTGEPQLRMTEALSSPKGMSVSASRRLTCILTSLWYLSLNIEVSDK